MAGELAVATANEGWPVSWTVPTYKNARPVWRFIESLTRTFAAEIKTNKTDLTVHFPSGGWFGVYTADNPVGMLGEAFKLAIGEEAARWPPAVFSETIQPTLADMNGDAILISTPRGMNWFATEFFRGQNDGKHQASFTAPTSANPIPNIRNAYNKIKELVSLGQYSERTFKQEWEAQFLSDGTYFQNVDACCVLQTPDNPRLHTGHTLGIGIDWGISNDWTRGRVGCRECDRVVDWFGFTGIPFTEQRGRIAQVYFKWVDKHTDETGQEIENSVRVLPERNSFGLPNIEMLQQDGLNIALGPDEKPGFNTSATTKPTLIEQLALALQRGRKYPKEDAEEMRAYEVTTSANGQPRFGAPEGAHDDRVIADALENWMAISSIQFW